MWMLLFYSFLIVQPEPPGSPPSETQNDCVIQKKGSPFSIEIAGGQSTCSFSSPNTLFCTGNGPIKITVHFGEDHKDFQFSSSQEFFCMVTGFSGFCAPSIEPSNK